LFEYFGNDIKKKKKQALVGPLVKPQMMVLHKKLGGLNLGPL